MRQAVKQEPIRVKYCLYARKSMEAEDAQALSIESQVREMTALATSSKDVGQRAIYNTFTNNPNEKFMLMIVGSQAKLENDQQIINVKRGLRARCEMGLRPCTAPTGYLNEKHVDKKCQVRLDPNRSSPVKKTFEKIGNDKWSGRQTYRWLLKIGFKTHTGKRFSLANLYILIRNPFYYGEFEYPKGSGEWYQGKHEPLITKELFERVQGGIQDQYIPKTESKEFAFDEKFKKLKDGGVNRHVYYRCTKAKDVACTNPAINETFLIEDLSKLLDTLDLDEIGMRGKSASCAHRLIIGAMFEKHFSWRKPV